MKKDDLEVLADDKIPEAVRLAIVEKALAAEERSAQLDVEYRKIAVEKSKLIWNTPFVAAIAGLLTLSATYFVDRLTRQEETTNTITLEQFRQELNASEARLRLRTHSQ